MVRVKVGNYNILFAIDSIYEFCRLAASACVENPGSIRTLRFYKNHIA